MDHSTLRNPGLLALLCCYLSAPSLAQTVPSLPGTQSSTTPTQDSANFNSVSNGNIQARRTGEALDLPNKSGQYFKTYDLKPYTRELAETNRPQQAVVDWVLRDTGTDVWFSEPFGFINADRDKLRVYHNEEMHQIVANVYERFVNGTTEPQLYGLRILAVGSPNWRTRAGGLLRSVKAQSPGVQAYLLSKENSAMLLAMLRGRTDFQELSAVDMVVHNGQSQVLEQLRGRNFVEDYQPTQGSWPPYIPSTGEIQEGYRLQLSPLLSVDKQTVDLVVKCNIDQVERLANVNLDLPLASGQVYTGQINVPQVASWRLHERFRWPADQVLVLSCGVVAAPQGDASNSLLGRGSSMFGIDRLLGASTGARADALLLIEYRGDAKARLAPTAPGVNTANAQQKLNPLSRGRY